MDWKGFEIFQSKDFAEIYSRHRNIDLCRIQGNNAFIFKYPLPLIGNLKMRIYLYEYPDINAFLRESLEVCRRKKILTLEIVTSSCNDDALNKYPYESLGTYVMDLSQDINALWKNLKQQNRTQIRYAEKSGVVVKQTNDMDEFIEWWKIYEKTSKRGNFVRQKYGLVEELFKTKKLSQLFVATVDNEIAAGVFILIHKAPFYWIGGSLPEYWKLKPNNLIHWKIIEWAHKSEYPYYDMGGAVKNSEHGPTRFKKQFGGEYKESYKYKININRIKSKVVGGMIKLRYRVFKRQ